MKSASLSALRTMILAGVLVTSALVTFAQSTPLSYPTYRRRELEMVGRPEFSLLFDQTHGLENLPFDSSSSREASLVRPKRIGSLSIVNPLDVLRQRVLLELARRKMRQDQWQVDANRRFLQTIGKRSNSDYESDGSELSEIEENNVFKNDELIQNKKQRSSPDRNSAKTQDQWYSDDNPDLREAQDDTQRNTQMANELHLL